MLQKVHTPNGFKNLGLGIREQALFWFSPLNEKMNNRESDWGDIWNLNCKKHEIDKVAKGKRWLTDDDSMINDFLSILTTKG